MHLFYHPKLQVGNIVSLEASEAIHITRVLRLRDGDTILLTDGQGQRFEAALMIRNKQVEAQVKAATDMPAREQSLELAVAPTKNQDRLEWLVEKAVEIGVEKIQLLQCEHGEKSHVRMERLHRVALAALKQSMQYHLPPILNVIPFCQWLEQCTAAQKLIAHCNHSFDRMAINHALRHSVDTAIAIGPEGDFSAEEIKSAISAGFTGVSLGFRRLRTETAAICAVHAFAMR